MPAIEFNVQENGQFKYIENSHNGLHPGANFTIEALVTPLAVGEDPTIFCRCVGKRWEPPFAAYRLGFYASTLIPEFQLLY